MSNGHNSGKPLRAGDPRELNGYRVVSRLGRGGMGTVYLAEDASEGRVALKLIHPDLADDESFRRRFAREVESAQRVARFSTAGVIDARLEGEPLYIVSEYVPGPNLDEAVRSGGPMAGGTLESLAMGVAAALTAIHGSGVVHRDLKPSNVLLSPVGPKVIDFGIARALDDSGGAVTRSSQLMGTPSYMAPELLTGEAPTVAADIFAWGCLVAFAGTGTGPFDAPTVPAVLHNISTAQPRLVGLDPRLSELVGAALDKNPRNRPTSQQILSRLTGQEQPGEDEVNRSISTVWAPPNSAPVPGAPPQEAGAAEAPAAPQSGPQQPQAGPRQQHSAPTQAHSGPQQPQAGDAFPQGQDPQGGRQTAPHSTPPTQNYTAQHHGPPPSGPRSTGGQEHPHGPYEARHPHPGQETPGQGVPGFRQAGPQQAGGFPHPGGQSQYPPHAHPSPAQGQQAFAASEAGGAPNGAEQPPTGPGQPPTGRGEDPDGGKRRKRTTLAVAGAAGLVLVLVAVVALTRPPSVPTETTALYSDDFPVQPDWVRDTFDGDPEANDGYWPEEQALLLHVSPETQESRGEYVELSEPPPDHVLVSATAHVLDGPGEALFGLRCWANDGPEEFTRYEAVVRADGEEAEIRRWTEERGENALAGTTDVSGFDEFENLDPDSDVPAGISGYSADEAVTNELDLACEYDREENSIELSLWINDSFVLSAVDDTPLPDDADRDEDRRQTGVMARAAPGNTSTVDVLYTSFSVSSVDDDEE